MNFTHGDISAIRAARKRGVRMAGLCALLARHTRDEIVEAIDATIRFQNDGEATSHVNRVLALQGSGVPLINGREAAFVTRDRGRVRYAADF